MIITVIVLVSAIGNMIIITIYNYFLFLPLSVLYPLSLRQESQMIMVPCLEGQPKPFLKNLGH